MYAASFASTPVHVRYESHKAHASRGPTFREVANGGKGIDVSIADTDPVISRRKYPRSALIDIVDTDVYEFPSEHVA
jgi:hypothetical protein